MQTKNNLKIIIISMILTIIMFCVPINNSSNLDVFAQSNYAKIVIELDSGRILYSENIYDKLELASTTKILTAITVIENCDNLDKVVTISKEAEGIEGSSIYLRCGDMFTIRDLLYGLMLRSGNDAATELALITSGSIKDFSILMNNTAKKCGAVNSNFTNPHGLHDDNHYTTAHDLALITSYALKNEDFSKICSTKKYTTINRKNNESVVFVNKNKMLYNYDGANGVKTGYTKDSGRCLVTSATRNDMTLICVVLNVYDMYAESGKLLDNCFDNYSKCKVLDKNKLLGKVKVDGLLKNDYIDVYIKNDIFLPLKIEELSDVNYKIQLFESVDGLYDFGKFLGKIDFFIDKELIFSSKLYTITDRKNYAFGECLLGVISRW